MNGKAAKRIRLAAERQYEHQVKYKGAATGETLRKTYRRLKDEYTAKPYHTRPCGGWIRHSHRERILHSRIMADRAELNHHD